VLRRARAGATEQAGAEGAAQRERLRALGYVE
jgi:hypothetical protein